MNRPKQPKNRVNVRLTRKVLEQTTWSVVAYEEFTKETVVKLGNGEKRTIPGKGFSQVLASPELEDVLMLITEEGKYLWYAGKDHGGTGETTERKYNMASPMHLQALFDAWNKDHGFMFRV